jgi:hypothetical protein
MTAAQKVSPSHGLIVDFWGASGDLELVATVYLSGMSEE